MRVLIAHNRYRLSGGEERHVELLEHGLRDAGVEVRRFERSSDELAGSPAATALTAATLAYRPRGGGIAAALEEFRPTVVHFHNLWPLLTPSALRTARRSGAAVVLTAHNYRFACPAGTLLRNGEVHEDCIEGSSLACGLRGGRANRAEGMAYGLALEVQRRARMLGRWVDAFIAPSRFMGEMLVRAGQAGDRVHVIAYGVPGSAIEALRAPTHALFAGRLTAEKGLRTLIGAAALAPQVPVVVAGAGPLGPEVERAPNNVTCLGPLDRSQLENALTGAAFTFVPSEWPDNLPFAALESLAAGRPVIATRMGGLPEIVTHEETGLLVEPGNPERLAEATLRLWNDGDLCRRFGAAAHRTADRRFGLTEQTGRVIDLYERVCFRR